MEDDDFTFPTVAAAGPGGRLGSGDVVGDAVVVARMPLQLPVPDLATAAAPLWPFAGSPKQATAPPPPSTAPVTKDDEEVPALGSNNGRRKEHRAEEDDDDEEDRRRRRVAADEERMDLLWAGATTTTTAPPPQSIRSGAGHSQPPPPPPKPKPEPEPEQPRAEAEDDKRRAAAVADAERMDKLWESFNEELLLRHALSKAAAADRAGAGRAADPADRWYLCSHSPSDAESDGTTAASSPAERRGYGCAPTMLRASSRAGGAGQFCGSPRGGRRRGGRGAAAGWALLLRLFRRLFAVDKAPASASSRSHASIYVP